MLSVCQDTVKKVIRTTRAVDFALPPSIIRVISTGEIPRWISWIDRLTSRPEQLETRRKLRWPIATAVRLLCLLSIVAVIGLSIPRLVESAMPAGPRRLTFIANAVPPSDRQQSVSVEVYIPKGAALRARNTVLVALHGVGSNGADFARPLVDLAEAALAAAS